MCSNPKAISNINISGNKYDVLPYDKSIPSYLFMPTDITRSDLDSYFQDGDGFVYKLSGHKGIDSGSLSTLTRDEIENLRPGWWVRNQYNIKIPYCKTPLYLSCS